MTIKEEILNYISQGRIKEALQYFMQNINNEKRDYLLGNITLLSSRFNRNEEMFRKNIISDKEYTLELNKITSALLDYLQKDFKH